MIATLYYLKTKHYIIYKQDNLDKNIIGICLLSAKFTFVSMGSFTNYKKN